MNNLTLEELEYLYNKFKISCPSDGMLAKRIEGKLEAIIQDKRYNDMLESAQVMDMEEQARLNYERDMA